ncbi:MAG: hypothetical protein ACR2QC_11200, partial [Gammaproteobacteria bacterium]
MTAATTAKNIKNPAASAKEIIRVFQGFSASGEREESEVIEFRILPDSGDENDSPTANEIPAFAGMGFFIFSDTAKFGIVRKDKKYRHSGESRTEKNCDGRKFFLRSAKKNCTFLGILVVYFSSEGVGAAIWEIGVRGVFYSKRVFFMKNFIFSLFRPLWAVYGVLNAISTPIQGGG